MFRVLFCFDFDFRVQKLSVKRTTLLKKEGSIILFCI